MLAALYGALSLIFVPFILLVAMLSPKSNGNNGFLAGGIIFLVFIPFLYAAFGFIGGLLMAAAYNLIVSLTGGIEMTFVDVPPPLNV